MELVLTRTILLFLFLYTWLPSADAQSGLTFDLKKPEKYENKKLGSEKTETKKWTISRRFVQNGVTKFNWHFNARNKLDDILERAKMQHKDDYKKLLSFYNYSLDVTSQEKTELDSVIYKANAGILIHDLRNTWVDNLYMLMGQAYYFRNEPDSAYMTFQFINYAFSPKEKDGYDIPIGSNATEGSNAFTISTKEKKGLAHKFWTTPPSRNESFIWQIRTFLVKDEFAEAAGLIETLKHDPQFPNRLRTDLYEVQAWWFYKREVYDSAAVYLEKALPNAGGREEKARWEYLIGQLYDRARKHDDAKEFFDRAVDHTLDPVLEIYARLNAIRQQKGDDKIIQRNVEQLAKMARRDRYTNYRDIIYYMAAKMELERNNVAGAKIFLLKSAASISPTGDNTVRAQAFLDLGDLSFNEKQYREARNFYDSASVAGILPDNAEEFENRRAVLALLSDQLNIISRQDSMLKIAAMSEADREIFIRKLVKQLRKQQGLKEEESSSGNGTFVDDKNAPTDLFGDAAKGDWYFSNNSLKSKGFNEFRNRWGNRPNVDNWRRISAANSAAALAKNNRQLPPGVDPANSGASPATALTYEALLQNVPLTPKQQQDRTDSIGRAKFILGKTIMEGLEDYPLAITTLEEFIRDFNYSDKVPQALFYLRYCYMKTGNAQKAAEIAAQLKQQFPDNEFEKIVANPGAVSADSATKLAMTKRYEHIYTLFIEGNFREAEAEKKLADSAYGKNYWTPQLLYIEAVYHIKERQDLNARKVLNDLITTFPESPLADKARNLVDVLARRKEIEDYLTKLQIERPAEDSTPVIISQPTTRPVTAAVQQQAAPPVTTQNTTQQNQQAAVQPPPVQQQPVTNPPAKQTTAQPPPPPIVTQSQQKGPIGGKDSTLAAPPVPKVYVLDTAATHMVGLVLDKVAPVYATETRNAFTRYNKEVSRQATINNMNVNDDTRLVLIDGFSNAAEALAYMEKAKKAAPGDIIPWLPKEKYTFIIISHNNLQVLTNSKDIAAYKAFLAQGFPGRF